MVSGQWSVVSGQWSVVSGQWSAVSGQLILFKAPSVVCHRLCGTGFVAQASSL
ncbi:MAG: hypothetical protein F6J90_13105 [Moorea sp. SIOASIH]|uniref:hypothetical protein n=1 Tax=Moorena sp. SIOASIH TaxID=2607817 RepID=UPI0013BC25A7|nr:hypothetical protein [Moorena sp. SIOASIH]NEO37205.1 hypothetical protein [Moorena sp. SIOASIH]